MTHCTRHATNADGHMLDQSTGEPIDAFGYRLDGRGAPIRGPVIQSSPVESMIGEWPNKPMWLGATKIDPHSPFPVVAHALVEYLVSLDCAHWIAPALTLAAARARWCYEECAPDDDADYAVWFAESEVICGVRMGPLP